MQNRLRPSGERNSRRLVTVRGSRLSKSGFFIYISLGADCESTVLFPDFVRDIDAGRLKADRKRKPYRFSHVPRSSPVPDSRPHGGDPKDQEGLVCGCRHCRHGCSHAARKTECIAPAKPGGGFDLTCKLAQGGLQNGKFIDSPMRVTYMPGGIGAVAYNTVIAQRPDEGGTIVAFGGSLLNLAIGKFGLRRQRREMAGQRRHRLWRDHRARGLALPEPSL